MLVVLVGPDVYCANADPASGPDRTMSSAYGDFVFNTTARPTDTWFMYKLDDSSWAPTQRALRVGPLAVGSHTLWLRTVGVGGEPMSSPLRFDWTVIAASDSQLSFSGLPDGPHSLVVAAVDSLQHVELAPRRYTWIVDTVPPSTTATLASRYYWLD